jgi:hypothetical protein
MVSSGLGTAEHHERAKDMLWNGRRNRSFILKLGLLFHAAPKGEAVFDH